MSDKLNISGHEFQVEDNKLSTEIYGHKLELDDGVTRLETKSGASVTLGKDGNAGIDMEKINRVGVSNILDLKSYSIKTDGGITAHKIEFNDGGNFTISYHANGKLIQCSGEKVSIQLPADEKGAMVVGQSAKA
jgi:hypothetical protein